MNSLLTDKPFLAVADDDADRITFGEPLLFQRAS